MGNLSETQNRNQRRVVAHEENHEERPVLGDKGGRRPARGKKEIMKGQQGGTSARAILRVSNSASHVGTQTPFLRASARKASNRLFDVSLVFACPCRLGGDGGRASCEPKR